MKEIYNKPMFQNALSKIVLIIIIVLIFIVGEMVGYHKAEFSMRLGDNYNKMFFEGHKMGMMGFAMDNRLANSHGASGTIVKITLPQIVIEGKNSVEQIITLDTQTILKESRTDIASTSLKIGDEIIVLGKPGPSGEVQADLIRVISSK